MQIRIKARENNITECECPFCNSNMMFVKDDVFSCFACGKSGSLNEIKNILTHNIKPGLFGYPEDAKIILSINEKAAMLYYENLKEKNAGSSYFRKRGIKKEDVDQFGLGYAPDNFTWLYDQLKNEYNEEDLEKSGLFRRGKYGLYDFFRNRVMFPIFGYDGSVIAFGGRVMDDSKPKYINSPENEIFSKHENLYGFPYDEKPKSESIFICEGYMDLIAVKKAGISDSAAVLGTALTKDHARLIASRYQHVYLGLDSDAAGINAIKRSLRTLHAYGLSVSVPEFMPAKDPDEFYSKYGGEKLKKKIEEAKNAERVLSKYVDANTLLDILLQST